MNDRRPRQYRQAHGGILPRRFWWIAELGYLVGTRGRTAKGEVLYVASEEYGGRTTVDVLPAAEFAAHMGGHHGYPTLVEALRAYAGVVREDAWDTYADRLDYADRLEDEAADIVNLEARQGSGRPDGGGNER